MNAGSRSHSPVSTSQLPLAFEVTLEGAHVAIRSALLVIRENLAPLDLSREELCTVELIVAEVLNNIVDHAFDDHPHPGSIRVHGSYQPNGLKFCFTDLGKPMPHSALRASLDAIPCLDPSTLPEGGFGMGLIKLLTDRLDYSRTGSLNCLTMRIPVGRHKQANVRAAHAGFTIAAPYYL